MFSVKKGGLARKLLLMILVCSLGISVVSAMLQIGSSYKSGLEQISQELQQLKTIHDKSLSKSLWVFDAPQIGIELEGIISYPDISFAEITSADGEVWSRGKRDLEAVETISLNLNFGGTEEPIFLGTLFVQASDAKLKARVKNQALLIVATEAVKAFFISAILLLLVNILITRHIIEISSYANMLGTDRMGPFSLDRQQSDTEDELDLLVHAINSMKTNLEKSFDELKSESIDRKTARDELYKQANLLETIINGIPAYIYWMDMDGHYLGCNNLYADLSAFGCNDIVGKTITQVSKEKEWVGYFHQIDRDVMVSGKAKWNQELTVDNKGGESSFYVQSVVPMNDVSGEVFGVLGLFIDITPKKKSEQEKKAMETQVVHSAKMASIGELAAGVGHEVNNPLAIVQGNLELLECHLEDSHGIDDESKKLIQNQMIGINRIRGIVDGLRVLARKDNDTRDLVDVHEAIMETFDLVNTLYKNEGVEISLELLAEKTIVMLEGNKFQQAILNLLSNAKDALLTKPGNDRTIIIRSYDDPSTFFLQVIDNGMGIPKETASKVFDPYFTTKPRGKGTGIGLDLTKKIVQGFGGNIQLETSESRGTCFTLSFPSASQFSKDTVKKLNKRFEGKLLVVDDDDTVRELVTRHLVGFGFEVDQAKSGVEALELAAKVGPYLGVFTDMRMPEMNGVDLLKGLHKDELLPQYKVLVTGGLDELAELNEQLDGDLQFDLVLNKPFSKRELERKLEELLLAA